MFFYPVEFTKKARLCLILAVLVVSAALPTSAMALDLVPDIFKSAKINRNIWKQQEQYVALAPQSNSNERRVPKNQHPVILDLGEVRDALLSLDLWVEGGFFRNEEAIPVLTSGQDSRNRNSRPSSRRSQPKTPRRQTGTHRFLEPGPTGTTSRRLFVRYCNAASS